MKKGDRYGKKEDIRNVQKQRKTSGQFLSGRDIIRLDKHIKIAPKHPNMGKR